MDILEIGGDFMPKDSQLDPKEVRKEKAKGGHTMAESAPDGEGRKGIRKAHHRRDRQPGIEGLP